MISNRKEFKPLKLIIHKIKLILIISLLLSCYSSAQNICRVSGWVTDSVSHIPIPNVNVSVDELNMGTITDSTGYFHLKLSSGIKYTIKFSHVGYEDAMLKFQLEMDHEAEFHIHLSSRLIELSPVVSISNYENMRAFRTFNENELKKAGGNNLERALVYLSPNIIYPHWARTRFSGWDNLNNSFYHNFTLYVNGKLEDGSKLEDIPINEIKVIKVWRMWKAKYLTGFHSEDMAPIAMPTIEGDYTILIVTK